MTKDEALKLALEALAANEFALMKVGQRGNGLHIQTTQAITAIKEALAQQPEQEPVAYLVIGPYEKQAFANINSANAYCEGLNKGFGERAYTVTNLYTISPELCKYGNETKSCTSAPMNCQCTHDAVFN